MLIDEIENAGVDKRRALDLLLQSDKIVIIATHDPVLALFAERRLVFGNGAVQAMQQRIEPENRILEKLLEMEEHFSDIRAKLRLGQSLEDGGFQ